MTHPACTPDNLQALPEGSVFCFGSNEAGRHGKGAALVAMRRFGAIYRQAEGLQGQAYGIPTVDDKIRQKLPVARIKVYVDRFEAFARARPDLTFYVTEIGCGLARHSLSDMAQLFRGAHGLPNVILPARFKAFLERTNHG